MAAPRKGSYRADLFNLASIMTLDAVENAVLEFESIVNGANIDRILKEVILHESPAIVRLAASSLDKQLVMSVFPTTPNVFASSSAHDLLIQLSNFFFVAHKIPALPDNHHLLVQDAPGLLSAIASKIADCAAAEVDPDVPGSKKGKPTSQKKAKMARRAARTASNTLDAAPFERLDIAVPASRDELEKALEIVLATQKSILEAYLESLRLPAVTISLRQACLPAGGVTSSSFSKDSDEAKDIDVALTDNFQPNDVPAQTSYAPPHTIRFSTLYRKRATGFGDWDINITPRADQDLRSFNKREPKVFTTILKKMRDLSKGDFSAQNHEQISGEEVEVPIYQARLSQDLRLVYQIDCIPIHDTKSEQQALKIFGVYEDAQVSRGTFWNSMSRELAKKGEQYKERCATRQRSDPLGKESCVFVPATFPAQDEGRLGAACIPDLPADDTEQIQALLLKTVNFSEYLLRSIVADLDVAFVLETSPGELKIIEHPGSCYVLGRSGTGKTTTMLYKMLLVEASSLDSLMPDTRKIRQIFVTQSRTLADKVGEHFSKLLAGYKPSAISENLRAARKADRALIFPNQGTDLRNDLPRKFSELQDADFPLFVSFEQLCMMIESDIEGRSSNSGQAGKKSNRLTYDNFKYEYWPHFPQSLCKGLDSSMVFSEFMGVIMGSEAALKSKSHYLDREAYLNIGHRRQSTFADQRGTIYDLFEKYLAEKKRRGDVDPADRTFGILESFQKHGVPGNRIDYLYVDETQDNLLVDTLLLRSLCLNPNGLFWAGDTAQTISVGSSFRFNELKAFQYRIEQQHKAKHPALALAAAPQPSMFQLTVNYRSHTGIVNCAHSLIDIITLLWPSAIDKLQPERGTVDGLRPIFFTNWDANNIQSQHFLFGEVQPGNSYELGADQCIIVRDKAAQARLVEELGDVGIIMTVLDAKGLEFNDVLLYNFFADSDVSEAQWRVVLNVLGDGTPAPALDAVRHASVCMELKCLYVAVTRARNNIWIADCSTKGEPMRTVWTRKDRVQNCILGTDTPRFAISSTTAEWQERGRELFESGRFYHARVCYERAYMPREASIAHAYHLQEEARTMPANSHHDLAVKKAAFSNCATAFMGCAADEVEKRVSRAYFCVAGECFEHAEHFLQAIAAYNKGHSFTRVAELYHKLNKFDEAIATIQTHRSKIDAGVVEKIKAAARLWYFKKGETVKATRKELFDRPEEAVDYLSALGLELERASLLENLQNFSDAAEIQLKEGNVSKAVGLFLEDKNAPRASDCLLQGLWSKLSFAVLPNPHDDALTDLLKLVDKIDATSVPQKNHDEIAMFQAIATGGTLKLHDFGISFVGSQNTAAALLSLDHHFANPPSVYDLDVDALAKYLKSFFAYVKLVHQVAFNVDPCVSKAAQKLFGYEKEGENGFLIPEGSFLHRALPTDRPTSGGIHNLLTGSELRTVFQRSLRDRLVQRVRLENRMCSANKIFRGPCLAFVFDARCNRDNCFEEHIHLASLSPAEYTARVRIHLLQILIYQSLTNIDDANSQRWFWISRLYGILNPASYKLGSATSLDLASIPEAALGFQIAKEWVRGCAYALEFASAIHGPRDFLSRLALLAHLAFQLDGSHAMGYLSRASFMVDLRKPLIYRRPPQGQYVVAEYLWALNDLTEWSLSAGVIFLRHVITKGLPIQISILCDIAEKLCAGLVLANRQRFGPLHNATLPLSWLVRRVHMIGVPRDTQMCWLFVRALAEVLEPLYSGAGAEHLLFEGRSLDNPAIPYIIRNLFLARLCRCLGLLAYNFRSEGLRNFVLESVTSLRRDPNRRISPLYSRFVNARAWPGIASAVRASTDGSPLDEMVQLLHAPQPQPYASPDVRQIVYTTYAEIPQLLGLAPGVGMVTSVAARSQPAPQAQMPAVPSAHENVNDDEADDGLLPKDDSAPIDLPAISEPEPPSQAELDAAATIRRAILRTHRRAGQHGGGADAGAIRSEARLTPGVLAFFIDCRRVAVAMTEPVHQSYRVRLLGPLPHLLHGLDIVNTHAQKVLTQLLKEFHRPDTQGEALENIGKRLNDVQQTRKAVANLQKVLGPTSEMHTRHILNELKDHAERAISLLRALPFEAPVGLTKHLDLAYKGILQPAKPKKAITRRGGPKPKLNTDESYNDDMYDDYEV